MRRFENHEVYCLYWSLGVLALYRELLDRSAMTRGLTGDMNAVLTFARAPVDFASLLEADSNAAIGSGILLRRLPGRCSWKERPNSPISSRTRRKAYVASEVLPVLALPAAFNAASASRKILKSVEYCENAQKGHGRKGLTFEKRRSQRRSEGKPLGTDNRSR